MWFSSLVSFVIEAAVAANATASTPVPSGGDVKSASDAEPKNKRQVDEYLRTPGTSAAASLNDQGPQAFPLQLSHGIYSQQRAPLYTRRPTAISHKPQVTEDDVEQEQQQQRQVRFSHNNQMHFSPINLNNECLSNEMCEQQLTFRSEKRGRLANQRTKNKTEICVDSITINENEIRLFPDFVFDLFGE